MQVGNFADGSGCTNLGYMDCPISRSDYHKNSSGFRPRYNINSSALRPNHDKQLPSPVAGIGEVKHGSYIRSLAVLAVVGILIGLLLLTFWSYVSARPFDRQYAIDLLARHDANIKFASFVDMRTEQGRELFSHVLYSEPNSWFGARDVTISTAVNETTNTSMVVDGAAVWLGATTFDIGTVTRSWRCPGGTWVNVSTEETAQYLYVGATGNRPVQLLSQNVTTGLNLTDENMVGAATSSQEQNFTRSETQSLIESVHNAMNSVYITQANYFNPAERDAYERQKAEMLVMTDGCEEVHV